MSTPKYYFSTRDLVIIAVIVSVQTVVGAMIIPFIRGFVHGVLHLPGPGAGIAIFGGIMFSFWIMLAYGLTMKKGTAILASFLMGITHFLYGGIGPLAGPPVIVVYMVTGLFVELGLLLKHASVKYLTAGMLGNTSFLFTFVGMMGYYRGVWGVWMIAKGWTWIIVFTVIGIISGIFLGGSLVVGVLRSLQKAGIAPIKEKKI